MSRDWRHYARAVSREWNVPVNRILARDAHREPTLPRQALYHILCRHQGLSFKQAGRLIGRSGPTVRRGSETAAWRITHQPDFAERYRRACA